MFSEGDELLALPEAYTPVITDYFTPSQIYLAKGSLSTPERRKFVEDICRLYSAAEIIKCPDTPHNRIDLQEKDPLALHRRGKQTLVFGELKNAVRFSEEGGNTCPNYWHFSPYGFCPYGCTYCYLAGTQGVKFSPTVKIYVNLPEILGEIDATAHRLGKPTAFYLGKLQDPLALDPLTAYSTVMVPFFASHPFARLTLLTKSTNVDRLLDLEHNGHTTLSWSVNPPKIASVYEENLPPVDERLKAMRRVAAADYPVRAVVMPVIPVVGWREIYREFTIRLLENVPLQRLTLGGICIYRGARQLMERKLGTDNPISNNLVSNPQKAGDGRARYPRKLRQDICRLIVETAREICPELEVALCLEEQAVWQALNLKKNIGHCNCVL